MLILIVLTMFFAAIAWATAKVPLFLNIREEPVGPSQVIVGGPPGTRYVGLLENRSKSSVAVLLCRCGCDLSGLAASMPAILSAGSLYLASGPTRYHQSCQ